MGYIHFPTSLTEEEYMLQSKYTKLRKKRKALQLMKTPKSDNEKPTFKKSTDARDAREVARKLIKSGAIPAIKKPVLKQDQTSFKRPKGQERKRATADHKVTTYQPFSSTQNDVAQESVISEIIKEEPRVQNLYQHFVLQRKRVEKRYPSNSDGNIDATTLLEKQRSGHTIFVAAPKISEEFLKRTFSEFGNIVHISMEIEKGRGFVTFNKSESATRALVEMHTKNRVGSHLQVQLARRQPQIEAINDATSSVVWSSIAASKSQKGTQNHKDRREMVQYNEDFLL